MQKSSLTFTGSRPAAVQICAIRTAPTSHDCRAAASVTSDERPSGERKRRLNFSCDIARPPGLDRPVGERQRVDFVARPIGARHRGVEIERGAPRR